MFEDIIFICKAFFNPGMYNKDMDSLIHKTQKPFCLQQPFFLTSLGVFFANLLFFPNFNTVWSAIAQSTFTLYRNLLICFAAKYRLLWAIISA